VAIVRRYRTEIVIAEDRFVVLQLPPDVPTGRAQVLVQVEEPDPADREDAPASFDEDIEWWDEFGEAPAGEEPWGLSVRLSSLES
jgi:hypothetical protein